MRSSSVRSRYSGVRSRSCWMWTRCSGRRNSRSGMHRMMQSSVRLGMDYWNRCRSCRMTYWQRWGLLMIFWSVCLWHARMVIPRMRRILLEMTINFAVPLRTVIAFKCLSRMTKGHLHLHLRRACRCALDFGSVLGHLAHSVDVYSSFGGSTALVKVMGVWRSLAGSVG